MTKKTLVSGCFDMLHSGHVAFFQEAAQYGDLYVVIGSDRNVFHLKQRPTINNEAERQFMIQSLACVKQVLVAKGSGMLDFVEELKEIKPDFFVVNEDGSSPEKENLCKGLGIEYVVLKREPHSGLQARSTTALRSASRLPEALPLAGCGFDLPAVSGAAPGPVLTLSIEPQTENNSPMRSAAIELWGALLPADKPEKLAKNLFGYCNLPGTRKIQGSAGAIGLTHAGLSRADYAGDYWPVRISNHLNEPLLQFIENSLFVLPMEETQPTAPLGLRRAHITHENSQTLASATEACWQALLNHDRAGFGASLRQNFEAQIALFPDLLSGPAHNLIETMRGQVLGWSVWQTGTRATILLVADQPLPQARRIAIRRVLA
jgi:cytidyltransferase-like protein